MDLKNELNSAYSLSDSLQNLIDHMKQSRLPIIEPTVFDGDIFSYAAWRHSFNIIIDNKPISGAEKLNYLSQYVCGEIKKSIEGYLWIANETAYEHTLAYLDERYGDSRLLAHAFRDKIDSWPSILENDGPSLRNLSDFLIYCQRVKENNSYLNILDNIFENQKILKKLPGKLVLEWVRFVHEYRKNEENDYPPFADFVNFLKKEADVLCDPLLEGINLNELSANIDINDNNCGNSPRNGSTLHCLLCKKEHLLESCDQYLDLNSYQRKSFCVRNRLCFRCLGSRHRANACKHVQNCKICNERHSVTLHKAFQKRSKQSSQSPAIDDKVSESKSQGTYLSVGCQTDEFVNNMANDAETSIIEEYFDCYAYMVKDYDNTNNVDFEDSDEFFDCLTDTIDLAKTCVSVNAEDVDQDDYFDCKDFADSLDLVIDIPSGADNEKQVNQDEIKKDVSGAKVDKDYTDLDHSYCWTFTDISTHVTDQASVLARQKSSFSYERKKLPRMRISKFLLWLMICTLIPMFALSTNSNFESPHSVNIDSYPMIFNAHYDRSILMTYIIKDDKVYSKFSLLETMWNSFRQEEVDTNLFNNTELIEVLWLELPSVLSRFKQSSCLVQYCLKTCDLSYHQCCLASSNQAFLYNTV